MSYNAPNLKREHSYDLDYNDFAFHDGQETHWVLKANGEQRYQTHAQMISQIFHDFLKKSKLRKSKNLIMRLNC